MDAFSALADRTKLLDPFDRRATHLYSAQSALIRSKLRYVNLSDAMRCPIKIDTVDSYQGCKENPGCHSLRCATTRKVGGMASPPSRGIHGATEPDKCCHYPRSLKIVGRGRGSGLKSCSGNRERLRRSSCTRDGQDSRCGAASGRNRLHATAWRRDRASAAHHLEFHHE